MVHLSGPITAAIVLLQPENGAGKLLVLFPQLGNPEWRWSQCECEPPKTPVTRARWRPTLARGAASAVFAAAEHLPPGQVRRIVTQIVLIVNICVRSRVAHQNISPKSCHHLGHESEKTSQNKRKKIKKTVFLLIFLLRGTKLGFEFLRAQASQEGRD